MIAKKVFDMIVSVMGSGRVVITAMDDSVAGWSGTTKGGVVGERRGV